MTVSTRLLPFAVLFCALLWGSAFPGIKGIYADWAVNGIKPTSSNRLLVAGVRFAIAGFVLLLMAKQPLQLGLLACFWQFTSLVQGVGIRYWERCFSL